MKTLSKKFRAFLADEQGATAVEYGLLVALIAAAISATVLALGGQLNTLFEGIRVRLGGTTAAPEAVK